MNLLDKLPRPFFVLAPMYDVTDTVFRQVIADCAPPDLFFTEFVNVDGLQSSGRRNIDFRLRFSDKERPIIAQVWGQNPGNFQKTATGLVEAGFDGIDLNFGCPDKAVVKNGCCVALVNNRPKAAEIIQAAKKGARSASRPIPVSVKTRLGFNEIDLSWIGFLLAQNISMLAIHLRTRKEMSKVPAHWEVMERIIALRNQIAPETLIVGNGDIMNRRQGLELAERYRIDGIMVGRGVFHDPFIFAERSPWIGYDRENKIELYQRHVELFIKIWGKAVQPVAPLNKFCKIYINGFDGAKEMRSGLMTAKTADELLRALERLKKYVRPKSR